MSTIARFREYEIEDEKARLELENLYFDNVESMKVATTLKSGDVVRTLGYYSVNDGGSGLYTIRTKLKNDSEDNGSIHFIDVNLVAELIVNDNVNVLQFGAIADDTTDNSIAFNNCIKYCQSKRKEMIIPGGLYVVNEPLKLDFVCKLYDHPKWKEYKASLKKEEEHSMEAS